MEEEEEEEEGSRRPSPPPRPCSWSSLPVSGWRESDAVREREKGRIWKEKLEL
jgi:hypothetical protein